jgi:hypothetical protein
MITLNKADVIEAAKWAYDQKLLQMQNIDPTPGAVCSYRQICAIGAAMQPEEREYCDQIEDGATDINGLIAGHHVGTDDRFFLVKLQDLHDKLCRKPTPEDRAEFCAMIGVQP